jgi:hypothetical protein
MTDRFFTMLKSLEQFDELEVRNVLAGLLSPSEREKCFITIYHRTTANVSTLLELKKPKHFQAISMRSRALFELAVDIRLIDTLPQSCEKMIAFVNVEKLRCARKILRFKAQHPGSAIDTTTYDSFVTANGASLNTVKARLWPNLKKVDHWSGRDLRSRVALLNAPETVTPLPSVIPESVRRNCSGFCTDRVYPRLTGVYCPFRATLSEVTEAKGRRFIIISL